MGLEMFGGSFLGIAYRIIAFIIGGIREKRQKHEDACNARISGNAKGINSGDNSETTHCANVVAVLFAVTLCFIMVVCVFYPNAEYTRIIYQPGDADKYLDLFILKWTWAVDLRQHTVTTSSGDFLYTGFQVMQFCITALYKPK